MFVQTTINGFKVTTQFGAVDSSHNLPHKGIDLAMDTGTLIHSPSDGVIEAVVNEGHKSFGESIHFHCYDGHEIIFGHLSDIEVKVGQAIRSGDVIALSGNTGDSTGAHLHVQIYENGKLIDPTPYLQAHPITEKVPWWDVTGQLKDSIELTKYELHQQIIDFGNRATDLILNTLDIIFPTVMCVGVLWWMFPFFPKSDKAPKLVGTAVILYMFYILAREA